jgi:hypothetical protein
MIALFLDDKTVRALKTTGDQEDYGRTTADKKEMETVQPTQKMVGG